MWEVRAPHCPPLCLGPILGAELARSWSQNPLDILNAREARLSQPKDPAPGSALDTHPYSGVWAKHPHIRCCAAPAVALPGLLLGTPAPF